MLQVGETVVADDCSLECTCQPGGTMNCTQLEGCGDNEVCQITNGQRTCYCPVGYFNGDGVCQRNVSMFVMSIQHINILSTECLSFEEKKK